MLAAGLPDPRPASTTLLKAACCSAVNGHKPVPVSPTVADTVAGCDAVELAVLGGGRNACGGGAFDSTGSARSSQAEGVSSAGHATASQLDIRCHQFVL